MSIPFQRMDMYRNPHKALRACMTEALAAVGRMDPQNDAETGVALAQVRELLAFCQAHLKKEEEFVHPAMEARAPGSSRNTAGDHVHHLQAFNNVEAAVAAVEQANGPACAQAASRLYKCLALFVGENFVHMHIEETENAEVLWRTHSDAELIAIEQAIVASLSSQEKIFSLRWMIPALNHQERMQLMGAVRNSMPPLAFAGVLAMLKLHLSDKDWKKLNFALGATNLAA